jgi:hypothetical protein
MFQTSRPAGRIFYLALALVMASCGISLHAGGVGPAWGARAGEDGSAGRPAKATADAVARAAFSAPQGGPELTSVIDTVYMADGTPAQGILVITWPAFVAADGTAMAPGSLDVTLGTNGALNVALAPNAGDKPGAEKKDAAMSFLQNALAMTDAVAAREIINPEKFRDGISMIIDGTVECLNASTWCKQPPASNSQPTV